MAADLNETQDYASLVQQYEQDERAAWNRGFQSDPI